MNYQKVTIICLLIFCYAMVNEAISKCDNQGGIDCVPFLIFDLSKNVTTATIFDVSIKYFLTFGEVVNCGGFKYTVIDENFNECGTSKGCKIVVHSCSGIAACTTIMLDMNFNNISSSYSDILYDENSEESKSYIKCLKKVFEGICPCPANTVLILTNRMIFIPSDSDVIKMAEDSSIKFTTMRLGKNDINATELLENSTTNIPNSTALSFPNFDCLNYLFYCLEPCSNVVPHCMQTDIDDCQIITTAPNEDPGRTLHAWVVFAFNEPFEKSSYENILQSLRTGIRNFVAAFGIKQYRLRFVYDNQHITNSYENVTLIYSDNLPDIKLTKDSGDVNNNTEINQRLSLIPWNGTLIQARFGYLSVTILTNFASTNLQTFVNGQNLLGQMYIYNSNSYKYYESILKNGKNFNLILPETYTDPIVISSIRSDVPTSTPNSTSTAATVTTILSTTASSTSTLILNSEKKSLSNTAKILIICGSIVGILIIIAVIAFKIYQTRKRNAGVGRIQMRHGRLQSLKRDHLGTATSICDSWELTWDRLEIKNDELSTGENEHLLHGILLSDFRNGAYQSSCEVAIKMPNKCVLQVDRDRFFNELNMMKKVTGIDNIVTLLGCITKGDRICMCLELCSNLDLQCYVREKKLDSKHLMENEKQTRKEFYIFAWQILHGLQSLGEKLIIHRNLSAKNVLISSGKNAMISDFGLAIYVSNKSVLDFERRNFPFKWLAIEILKNDEFSFHSDMQVWAFGIVLFEMYSFGEPPYEDIKNDDFLDYLEAGNRLEKPDFCSDKIFEIMSKCWSEDPSSRPPIKEIINDYTEFLKQSTEGYGVLELMETAADNNNKKLMRQFSSL